MLVTPLAEGPCVYIAIPVQDESVNLPLLYNCLTLQTYQNFKVVFCVNQPDSWWQIPDKNHICLDNVRSIELLSSWNAFTTIVIDRCTPGNGWNSKHFGVGWARKTALDACREMANPADLLLCLDADTLIKPNYLESIVQAMTTHPECVALSVPYYHQPADNPETERAMLRYEIYMRYYAINLWRIQSYYCFTALGSAIAVSADAYIRIGGITPLKSGEDFYFLQKLRKFGEILYWCREKAFPASRLSSRVFFGTGPALIKGITGDWSSYPLYATDLFDEVKQTTDSFPALYLSDIQTPMDDFLKEIFKEENIWQPLRSKKGQFVRACHEKVDALRILQFLKSRSNNDETTNASNLRSMLETYYNGYLCEENQNWIHTFSFIDADLETLQKARELLMDIEEDYQKNHFFKAYIA